MKKKISVFLFLWINIDILFQILYNNVNINLNVKRLTLLTGEVAVLKNYMEDVVDHLLPSVLQNYNNICKCGECQLDIRALALNNLKPMYFVTNAGVMYLKLNELNVQFRADVINEIMISIERVSKKPRHCPSIANV
jgi:competence protein ComFB